jgi:phage-related protein
MSVKSPIILFEGAYFIVECAIRANGSSPSKKFIEELSLKDKGKILRIIKRYANFGKIVNREQFKKIEKGLWEFKNFQIRILMYHAVSRTVVLTHGIKKKKSRIGQIEIDKAYRIMEEYEKNKGG